MSEQIKNEKQSEGLDRKVHEILDRLNIEISKPLETVFDKFQIKINRKSVGKGFRDDLGEVFNSYGRINELASKSLLHAERAKARRDRVYAMASDIVNADPRKMTAETKRNLIKITKVIVDGESTSFIEEEEKYILYSYVSNRGKNKQVELATMIDLGRSILSFDKSEIERIG